MTTAKELGLRKGYVVRVATPTYAFSRGIINLHTGEPARGMTLKDIDMGRGPRVEVVRTDVRYDVRFGPRGAHTIIRYLEDSSEHERKAGNIASIWEGYVGFIPESLERKEDNVL